MNKLIVGIREIEKSKMVLFGLVMIAIIFKWIGGFEFFELSLYDHYWRRVPLEPPDPRIVVVGIDEIDLRNWNQYTPSNEHLADVVTEIEKRKPTVIGFDIYRDLGVNGRLQEIFETSPTLVGAGVLDEINFPPALEARKRVADTTASVDSAGGILRRIPLYAKKGSSIAHLSLKVIFEHLRATSDNWEMGANPKTGLLMIEQKVIPEWIDNDGGYSNQRPVYRMLIRWRKRYQEREISSEDFTTWTYRELKELPEDYFQGKIVLVGYRTPSKKDVHPTPFGMMYGVDTIAHETSQILSYLEDDRPFFRPIPEGLEYVLLMLVILIAYLQSSHYSSKKIRRSVAIQLVLILSTVTGIYGGGLWLFIKSWWLPTAQLILTYLASIAILFATRYLIRIQENDRNLKKEVAKLRKELERFYRWRIIEEKQIRLGRFARELTHDLNTEIGSIDYSASAISNVIKTKETFCDWIIDIAYVEDEGEALQGLKELISLKKLQFFQQRVEAQQKAVRNLRQSLSNLQAIYHDSTQGFSLFDVSKALQKSIKKIEKEIALENPHIEVLFNGKELGTLNYYEVVFQQMILHLLRNAKDAISSNHQPEGLIEVYAVKNKELTIQIKDNGMGINLNEPNQIFEEGFTTKEQGMGWGLYFVYQQMLEIEGKVEVESTFQKGTIMTLIFPSTLMNSGKGITS